MFAVIGPFETDRLIIVIPMLAVFAYSGVSVFVVLLEIWERFGLIVAIVALIISPVIPIYWLSRINGFSDNSSAG